MALLRASREDLRQLVAVSARLEGRDLGSAMSEIQTKLGHDKSLPVGVLEFGGLFQQQEESFHNLIVASEERRLRPVLMTSLAAALGLMPLAYGIDAGTDMLRPLAIAVIGALCLSVLLSLIATPTAYYLMSSRLTSLKSSESGSAGKSR